MVGPLKKVSEMAGFFQRNPGILGGKCPEITVNHKKHSCEWEVPDEDHINNTV